MSDSAAEASLAEREPYAASTMPSAGWSALILFAYCAAVALAYAAGALAPVLELSPQMAVLLTEHLALAGTSFAIALGLALVVWRLSRQPAGAVSAAALMSVNALAALPALAVIALAVALFDIGMVPTIVVLVLLTLAAFLRANLARAPHTRGRVGAIDAVRAALAVNLGAVPLASLMGGGGLGELIFEGLALNEAAMVWAGLLPAIALPLGADCVLAIARRAIDGDRRTAQP